MVISLILAHPDMDSLNHALAAQAVLSLIQNGHDVRFHDLYAEGFDPRLSKEEIATFRSGDPLTERHCRELQQAEGLILIHPVWFFGVPAIMKGWVDRVVRQGVAFSRQPDGSVRGLLAARQALVISTANSSQPMQEQVVTFWRDSVLTPCGVASVRPLLLSPVVSSGLAQRQQWLEAIGTLVDGLFPRG